MTGPAHGGRPPESAAARPPRTGRRLVVLVVIAMALLGIGRTTGSGWMVVIFSGLSGLVVVAAVLPALTLRGIILLADAPPDATVGRPVVISISLQARRTRQALALRLVEPAGEWVRARAPARGEVIANPARRTVLEKLPIELRAGGPLGLVTWRRRRNVTLARPLEIGPRPADHPVPHALLAGAPGGDPQPYSRLGSDLVRTVREYSSGDSARLVHWPATARRGELMVKELEDPDRPRIALVVDLSGDAVAAEDAASRAAGLAGAVLNAGVALWMVTVERGGPLAAPVRTAREAGRRLARAIAGPTPFGPLPPGSIVVRLSGWAGTEVYPK